MYPEKLTLGMELRDKVTEFVRQRIAALRQQHPGQYTNISCVRSNAQKYLPNYFRKGELEKMFFLFPDPHFKVSNHRRRVISNNLATEYAYFLQPGGTIYTITDVPELGQWMKDTLDEHPLFQPYTEEELREDPVVDILAETSEEGQKVHRAGGQTYKAVYRRVLGEEER
ncbi:unnamed protein product [Ostreobium quekettii]|uniref:tRNA (guanine(46)-N(7))-methyltransferase n=1 Tax=Ostreobium quekettii TaxID=121088 RepID=A0A8S1IPC5_9CHLO|nr:unnamed protein product [Ostreobium quekettii]